MLFFLFKILKKLKFPRNNSYYKSLCLFCWNYLEPSYVRNIYFWWRQQNQWKLLENNKFIVFCLYQPCHVWVSGYKERPPISPRPYFILKRFKVACPFGKLKNVASPNAINFLNYIPYRILRGWGRVLETFCWNSRKIQKWCLPGPEPSSWWPPEGGQCLLISKT